MGVLPSLLTEGQSFVCFPHNLHPLQAILCKEAGICRPISSSLKPPKADRPIRNTAIWASCDDWYSEMEAQSASRFLEAHGIETNLFLGRSLSKSDFVAMYACPDYDFIHVSGHGVFDHWELGSSQILINEAESISVDELVSIDLDFVDRRLLCLNICDGGVSDGLGGIQKLGLAPSLASPNQATISHLWPVEPRVASAFGLLLCSEIASQNHDYFNVFSEVLNALRSPWAERVASLREKFDGDIIVRLENFDATDDIFDWGSPVFFQ